MGEIPTDGVIVLLLRQLVSKRGMRRLVVVWGKNLIKVLLFNLGLLLGKERKKGVVESEFSMFLYGLVYFYLFSFIC